jgi:tetratricopeptide (TPR) repeat protein
MVVVLKKSLLTLIMAALFIWILHYGISWYGTKNRQYVFSNMETLTMKYFAEDWYNFGLKAWYENNSNLAADYFRKALAINLFHVDAWLKLAQVETGNGNTLAAWNILKFTNNLTREVVRWKWSQILLARELKLDDIFWENINFVIPEQKFQNEALQLLDIHLSSDSAKALEVLEIQNWTYYLRWLMKWNRTEDTFRVWRAIAEKHRVDDDLYQRYINYLVSQKEILQAAMIRKEYTGMDGLSNPGFELPLSNIGFDWRSRTGDHWEIQRTRTRVIEGDYALQMVFSGKENINFQHLSQIVPVLAEKTYRLSFWWRSKDLSTDQRPFVEIRGFDCKNVYWKSDMVPANSDWKQQILIFSIPESCNAATIGVKRTPSHRFDNKISGILWLDHFEMEMFEIIQH